MALTAADVQFWLALKAAKQLPINPAVLEIGEANWYGDVNPRDLVAQGIFDGSALAAAMATPEPAFVVAKLFYQTVLGYRFILAIDKHGTRESLQYDLNQPLPMESAAKFEVVINTGTGEHVFDQRQLFQSIHDHTAVGGLMVHAAPFTGWLDHGFYCYQPCFWRDLAAANGYTVVDVAHFTMAANDFVRLPATLDAVPRAEINTMLYIAFRKVNDDAFRVPIQGRYQGAIPT